jgi:hypothetical protein
LLYPGVGREALPELYDVFVEGQKQREAFSTQDTVTVMFHTRPEAPAVLIERIEWSGHTLQIHYSLVALGHSAPPGMALIPLDPLPPGEYMVEMIRSKNVRHNRSEFPPIEPGVERDTVCSSFKFKVADGRE